MVCTSLLNIYIVTGLRISFNLCVHSYVFACVSVRACLCVYILCIYSQASEQRTLWEWAFCPLFGGCPYLGGLPLFDYIASIFQ